MALEKIGAVAGAALPASATGASERFGRVLQQATPGVPKPLPTPQPERANLRLETASAIHRITEAQQRLDQVLRLAESGRTFTPAELLALQAQVYRASQQIDLAGKVVDKAAGGVKQVLQTQV